jgi:hypothetical protein
MATVIPLRKVVEAMELLGDDCLSYLDPDTGEIITVTEEERRLAEDESLDDVPEWQREMLPKIRAVLESDRFPFSGVAGPPHGLTASSFRQSFQQLSVRSCRPSGSYRLAA